MNNNPNEVGKVPELTDKARLAVRLFVHQVDEYGFEIEVESIRGNVDQLCTLSQVALTEDERVAATKEVERQLAERKLAAGSARLSCAVATR